MSLFPYNIWKSIFQYINSFKLFNTKRVSLINPLPAEIWQLIIEFAYDPIRLGWHRDLWRIACTSKMHYNIVKYFFDKYMNNPIFQEIKPKNFFFSRSNKLYLSVDDYLNITTKNCPIIEPGFFIYQTGFYFAATTISSVVSYYKHSLSIENCYNSKINFFEQDHFTKRCLVCKIRTVKTETGFLYWRREVYKNVVLEQPIIVIPYMSHIGIRSIFVIIKNSFGSLLYSYSDYTSSKAAISDWNNVCQFLSDNTRNSILRYVLYTNYPIPNTYEGLISGAHNM